LLSGWDGQGDFLDPMCGSGTFLAEAAMIACNIPANINRKEFAFEKWNDWDYDLFNNISDSLLKRVR
jgi:putative N6-adenine-specific DNA methylase